ncbi:ATP-binding cassette domain-containing protein, partial [Nonomuraea sp. NPDC055795]
MGIEVVVQGLSKSFGAQTIWEDVSLILPAGEISVMLGPSGTGKTVFLKSLIGLIKPERGKVVVNGVDMINSPDRQVYETRKLFGLMFQDGALFGSMNLYDNIAFPLREHTRKSEAQIRGIVLRAGDRPRLLQGGDRRGRGVDPGL